MQHRGRKNDYDHIGIGGNMAGIPAKRRSTRPDPKGIGAEPAPAHLSEQMREWWQAVTAQWDLDSPRLHLLQAACEAWDRMTGARQAVARLGLTFEGKDGPRPRPEIAVERDARIAFVRIIKELGLEPPKPDRRLTGGLGWIPPANG
jgi:P27 family predicted phage terminase small subunit